MRFRARHYWRREVRRKRPERLAAPTCQPSLTIGQLSAEPQEPLSWLERWIAFLTTPFKFFGISGWQETGCDAAARGRPVRDARHSTDGFWTIDVQLESLAIGTAPPDALEPRRFIRLEIEPGTLAHRFCARRFVTAGAVISFGGPVVVDTDGPFLEVHPDSDFEVLARKAARAGRFAVTSLS
jgi:hypothetical protein